MNILIVHAHPEPQSFSSALAARAREVFTASGHNVTVSDLYALRFDPVSDRRNFTAEKDAAYFKQQQEEINATEGGGFAPELEAEIRKLETADALIFSFPLYWFGMPAILKGWCDRVLAYKRIYGGPKLYETGLGAAKKRALILLTTGGGPNAYGGYGMNPPLDTILAPVQHGVFWFNGFLPLAPFVAWSAAHVGDEGRKGYLAQLDEKLATFTTEPPLQLPKMADFPDWGTDVQHRYMVTVSRTKPMDDQFKSLISAEQAAVARMKREGVILRFEMTPPAADPWHAFIIVRERSTEAVLMHMRTFPLAPWLDFDVQLLAGA